MLSPFPVPKSVVLTAISSHLKAAEGRARKRTLSQLSHSISDRLLRQFSTRRSGSLEVDGGAVPISYRYQADSTYLYVTWVRWYGQISISVLAERKGARIVPYGSGPSFHVNPISRMDRLRHISSILGVEVGCVEARRRSREVDAVRRFLEKRGIPLPPNGVEIKWGDIFSQNFQSIVTLPHQGGYLIGTPIGWFVVRSPYSKSTSPWSILRRLGVKVPRKEPSWEKVMDQFVLLALSGKVSQI